MTMFCCTVHCMRKRQIFSVSHYHDNMIAHACSGPAFRSVCVCVCVCVCDLLLRLPTHHLHSVLGLLYCINSSRSFLRFPQGISKESGISYTRINRGYIFIFASIYFLIHYFEHFYQLRTHRKLLNVQRSQNIAPLNTHMKICCK